MTTLTASDFIRDTLGTSVDKNMFHITDIRHFISPLYQAKPYLHFDKTIDIPSENKKAQKHLVDDNILEIIASSSFYEEVTGYPNALPDLFGYRTSLLWIYPMRPLAMRE